MVSSRKKKITLNVEHEEKLLKQVRTSIKAHTFNQKECDDFFYRHIKKRYKSFAEHLQAEDINACAALAMVFSPYRGRETDFGNYFISLMYLNEYAKSITYIVLKNSNDEFTHLCILDLPKTKQPFTQKVSRLQNKWVYDIASNVFFKMEDVLSQMKDLEVVAESNTFIEKIAAERILAKAEKINQLIIFQDNLIADVNKFYNKCIAFCKDYETCGLMLNYLVKNKLLKIILLLNQAVGLGPLSEKMAISSEGLEEQHQAINEMIQKATPRQLSVFEKRYESIKILIEKSIADLDVDVQKEAACIRKGWKFSLPKKYRSMFTKSIQAVSTTPEFEKQKFNKGY